MADRRSVSVGDNEIGDNESTQTNGMNQLQSTDAPQELDEEVRHGGSGPTIDSQTTTPPEARTERPQDSSEENA